LQAICEAMPHKTVYGFDTFEGLPKEKHGEGEVHSPGDFADTSPETVDAHLRNSGTNNFALLKGLFPDETWASVSRRVCFAHVDVDFEKSTVDCLNVIWPMLVP